MKKTDEGRRNSYTPNLEANELPVWYLDTDGTIAYHLYPNCGYITHRPEGYLSLSLIEWKSSDASSFEEWQEIIKGDRHMCKSCLSRFQRDYWEFHSEELLHSLIRD